MADEILLNKAETIERCIVRIQEIYANNSDFLRNDQTKQDAILLNLERACQASIDFAMRIVRLKKLGLPKMSREAFDLIFQAGIINQQLLTNLHGLVDFRNTAIHNDKKLDLDIVESVIKNRMVDFRELAKTAINFNI